jgi:endoglycosylceramidase
LLHLSITRSTDSQQIAKHTIMLSLTLLVVLCVFAHIINAAASMPTIKINPNTHFFIDSTGRTRFFHGVNAVYKIAPWFPAHDKWDPMNSLSAEDARNLRQWGFNSVRLGVMWPGLEPGARGDYSRAYLDEIQTIVELLAKENIYVILDLHQVR